MGDITVDDIPDETYAELAERAARVGLSMEDFVRRHVLEWARYPEQQPSGTQGRGALVTDDE